MNLDTLISNIRTKMTAGGKSPGAIEVACEALRETSAGEWHTFRYPVNGKRARIFMCRRVTIYFAPDYKIPGQRRCVKLGDAVSGGYRVHAFDGDGPEWKEMIDYLFTQLPPEQLVPCDITAEAPQLPGQG